MKQTEKKRANPVTGILWKLLLIAFLSLFLYTMVQVSAEMIIDYNKENMNQADAIERCDGYYYDRDFAGLRETMILYDLYDEIYDKYWEVVDGYEDYQYCLQARRALAMGDIQYMDKAEAYEDLVLSNAKNCKFSDNQNILQEFVEAIQ